MPTGYYKIGKTFVKNKGENMGFLEAILRL